MGRSLTVVRDLSVDEQRYLYTKTRQFKQAWLSGRDVSEFRITDPELNIYLLFMENSTRTKESFRNAALFHHANVNIFDPSTSSFQKSEGILDTVKMLFGYNRRSIFVMRTRMEGVCQALKEEMTTYAKRTQRQTPTFINAGDGRHEHPTQEFLDEFTFIEHKKGDWSHIHIALIGDLRHGRTIHSKVDGLKVFDTAKVDLIAPPELAMPDNYITRMRENGFEVRQWCCLQEYLDCSDVSACWYFTRLQLERMGDEIKEKEYELGQSVTFKKEWIDRLPEGTRFYHPLPRHKENPVIPFFLDSTALNGWDDQSINGYFTRVIELGLLTGKLGGDFDGQGLSSQQVDENFVIQVPVHSTPHIQDNFKIGIKPVDNGTVIDHIAKGGTVAEIWNQIDKIRRIMNLNRYGSQGVFQTKDGKKYKGIISLPDVMKFEGDELKKLAAVSPYCTLNLIENHSIQAKYRLNTPPRIYNLSQISCKNPDCITYPKAHQHISPHFYRTADDTFTCRYCEKRHNYGDIWDI